MNTISLKDKIIHKEILVLLDKDTVFLKGMRLINSFSEYRYYLELKWKRKEKDSSGKRKVTIRLIKYFQTEKDYQNAVIQMQKIFNGEFNSRSKLKDIFFSKSGIVKMMELYGWKALPEEYIDEILNNPASFEKE